MGLFQLGEFALASGKRSGWKLECDSLTDDDWKCLAELMREMVGPFGSVEGVPRGGVKLASLLKPFAGLRGPHLIVDDVLTTGGSLERARQVHRDALPPGAKINPGEWIVGAVVFARGQRPLWVKALFEMPECFWPEPRHRGRGV